MSNKITLNEAVTLKQAIQDKLIRYQNILKDENSIPSGKKRNFNLKQIIKDEEGLRQNMITLKLLIQEANLIVQKDETHCTQYYVFLLSERKRQIENLKIMPTDEGPIVYENPVNKVKSTVNYTCIFNSAQKEEWLVKYKKEYREVSDKLTKLNGSITIDLPFDPKKI